MKIVMKGRDGQAQGLAAQRRLHTANQAFYSRSQLRDLPQFDRRETSAHSGPLQGLIGSCHQLGANSAGRGSWIKGIVIS